MKSNRFLLALIPLMLLCGESQAQVSIGAQGCFGLFSNVGMMFGGGIEAGYGISFGGGHKRGGIKGKPGKARSRKSDGAKLFVCVSFNYFTGGKSTGYYIAQPLDPTYPEILVPYTGSVHIMQANAGAKYYFLGNMSSTFNLYGQLGLSLEYMPVTYSTESYDQKNYGPSQAPQNENNIGFALHAGVGMEVNVGFGHLYLAPRVVIPANTTSQNGPIIEIVIPFASTVDLGIRIPLGGR